MPLFDASVIVTRTVLYQGTIPLEQYGLRCVLCRTEVWPSYPGDNSPRPRGCRHVRGTRCPVLDIVIYPKRDVTDF